MFIMTAFLAVAGIFDHLTHRIPNILTGLMLVICIVLRAADHDLLSLGGAVLRVIAAGTLFFPFFAIGTLGAGDVKLMAVCAGFMDTGRYLIFVFFAMLAAAVWGSAVMIVKGSMKKRMLRLAIYIKRILETGKAERYHACREAETGPGIALAGALFFSAVLGVGGLY